MSAFSRRPEAVSIKGRATAGPIPCSNVRAGEAVFGALNLTTGSNDLSSFESVISVQGQILQKSSTDLSASEFWIFTFG